MADEPRAQFIEPPDPLRDKVTEGGPGAVNPQMLKRADSFVAEMSENYIDSAKQDLARLRSVFEAATSGKENWTESLSTMFEIAHNIKGQGGSFGYDLMTLVANQLCLYIDGLEQTVGPDEVAVLGLHTSTLQMIIGQDLKGDGGAAGQELVQGLIKVVEKQQRN